jgi:hypothetical protein
MDSYFATPQNLSPALEIPSLFIRRHFGISSCRPASLWRAINTASSGSVDAIVPTSAPAEASDGSLLQRIPKATYLPRVGCSRAIPRKAFVSKKNYHNGLRCSSGENDILAKYDFLSQFQVCLRQRRFVTPSTKVCWALASFHCRKMQNEPPISWR